jgi:hypothetical protein
MAKMVWENFIKERYFFMDSIKYMSVWGLGFGVWGLAFGVWRLLFVVYCLLFVVYCLWFVVCGFS